MRVVTWNLWWRLGPWAEQQKAILAVLPVGVPAHVSTTSFAGGLAGPDGVGTVRGVGRVGDRPVDGV